MSGGLCREGGRGAFGRTGSWLRVDVGFEAMLFLTLAFSAVSSREQLLLPLGLPLPKELLSD